MKRASTRAMPVLLALLLIVTVALAVAGGLLGARAYAAEQAEQRRQAILHAAKQQAVNIHSLSYKTVDSDLRRILSGATGDVRKTFSKEGELLRQALSKSKARSNGKALEAGIVSADKDSAEVLVVADSTVKNEKRPEGAIRHYRIWMGLVRKGDRWLVSDMGYSKLGFQR